MVTVYEILMKARGRIDSPDKWCKGDYFKDGKCCLAGALHYALSGKDRLVYKGECDRELLALTRSVEVLVKKCSKTPMSQGLHHFNDRGTTTHQDVMRVMDEAIALAKKEVQDGQAE